MALSDIRPKFSELTPRAMLLKIHSDLLTIHRSVHIWSAEYPENLTNLEKMVIVLEDRRFLHHPGVDFQSALREMLKAFTFRRHGGASTIDMQFVRTVTGYRKKTVGRKLYEIILSLIIQFRYNKIVILRAYLDNAFFGSRIVGANKAAMVLFSSTPEALSLENSALLASMLVYPRPLAGGDVWLARIRRRAEYGMIIYARYKKSFDQLPG